jgi:hypothetical protein
MKADVENKPRKRRPKAKRKSRARKPLPWWRRQQRAIIHHFERHLSGFDPNNLGDNDPDDSAGPVSEIALYALLQIAKKAKLPRGRQPNFRPDWIAAQKRRAASEARKKAALAVKEEIYVPLRQRARQYVAEDKAPSLLVRKAHAKQRLIEEAQRAFAAKGLLVPSEGQIGREGHFFRNKKKARQD